MRIHCTEKKGCTEVNRYQWGFIPYSTVERYVHVFSFDFSMCIVQVNVQVHEHRGRK
jgi:hypothetical protein